MPTLPRQRREAQPVPDVRPARAGSRVVRGQHARGVVPFPTHLAREGRMTVIIGRRELLAALGGAAVAWPLAARAQQPSLPVIGILAVAAPEANAIRLSAFREGLRTAGYIE